MRPRVDRWFVATLPGPRGATGRARCATRCIAAGVAAGRDPQLRPTSTRAYRAARDAAGEADRIVVFGSFLTVAAALAAHRPAAIADQALAWLTPDDVNVDELKRRARRRLVGAIVLALAAAVIVPMLLESDPKPLGEDVSVKIPPVDDGKFVNRLTDKGEDRAAPRSRAAAATDAMPRKSSAEAGERPSSRRARDRRSRPPIAADGAAPAAKADAAKDAAQSPRRRTRAAPAAARAPSARHAATPSIRHGATPRKAAGTDRAPSPTAAEAPRTGRADARGASPPPRRRCADGFSVQLAAFSDDKGANALANKLKNGGLSRVHRAARRRAGHAVARARRSVSVARAPRSAARDKLKGEGHNGIVAPPR